MMAAAVVVPAGDVAMEDVDLKVVAEPFSLEILPLIKNSQLQHGLRHGDFQRYRSYCSRRLRRIRKAVGFVQGNKHRYTPKKLTTEKVTDIRFLYIPLVCAERCWSSAMELKGESREDGRKRYHMVNKLRKAVTYAEKLLLLVEELGSENCHPRTMLETQAYCDWMRGTLQFELRKWQEAQAVFVAAKTIYNKLASTLPEDSASIYGQKVAEEIEPSLRYCRYNLGGDTPAADIVQDLMQMRIKAGQRDLNLDDLIDQTRERQAGTFTEATWCGRVMPVRSEKVRVVLLAAQETTPVTSVEEVSGSGGDKEEEGLDGRMVVFDRLLKECTVALQILKEELKGDQAFRSIQRGQELDGRVSNAIFLHTYITYIKLTKTVERNLVMCEGMKAAMDTPQEGRKTPRAQDMARLYEIMIQTISEIPTLPGLDSEREIQDEVACLTLVFKAYRCYYLALSYRMSKQWPQVVALCHRAVQYIEDALKCRPAPEEARVQGHSANQLQDLLHSLKTLAKWIENLKYSSQASSIQDTSPDGVAAPLPKATLKDKKILADHLSEYREDPYVTRRVPKLARFPPDFQPAPCKPLFYDLAFYHLDYPSLDDKVEKTPAARSGLGGFVKSLFWGSSKK